jgi:hypothetical protein
MRHLIKIFAVLVALCSSTGLFAKEKAREETVLLDKHRVTISVPEGYVYSSGRDEQGIIMAKLSDPKEKVDLQVRFQTDTGARLGGEAQQMEFLANVCRQYAESSVEKGYEFRALEPRKGNGTYCSFTDATLAGRLPIPKGEFLHVTTGVKVWNGCVLIFTVLSNDVTSKEYQTALKLVKESFEETPAPAAKT